MKMKRMIAMITVFLLLLVALTSCTNMFKPTNSTLHGGEILDDELMSEIRDAVFATGSMPPEIEEIESKGTVAEGESEEAEIVVYWTKSGSVWHTDKNCRYLRDPSKVLSGSIAESGNGKACSSCGDKTPDIVTETDILTETESVTEGKAEHPTDSTTESSQIETEIETKTTAETETKEITETDELSETTEACTETEMLQAAVYWRESGEVWHLKRDCSYIRDKEVATGTVEDAMKAGKLRACSRCSK